MFEEAIPFAFKFTSADGTGQTLSASAGTVEADALVLDGERLPYAGIVGASSSFGRLFLQIAVDTELGPKTRKRLLSGLSATTLMLSLLPRKFDAQALRRLVDVRRSIGAVAKANAELLARGTPELFRAEPCKVCGAVVDLSGLPESDWRYCSYCDSAWSERGAADGDRYDLCPECGFWDRVHDHSLFNFVFLLAAVIYSSPKLRLCSGCARRKFAWQLTKNLPFLLGIPSAVGMYRRARHDLDEDLRELPLANMLAVRRRTADALALYQQLRLNRPDHPGLLYNEGHAHRLAGDLDAAEASWRACLAACSGFAPAIMGLLGTGRWGEDLKEAYRHRLETDESPADKLADKLEVLEEG